MFNMSGMQKSAPNKLLQKRNILMPMLRKQNTTYANERVKKHSTRGNNIIIGTHNPMIIDKL